MSEGTLIRARDPSIGLAVRTLIRAGADGSLVEDFRALADATAPDGAPRYARGVLEDLARFLVRGSAHINRDAALFELCHLVNAVDACGRTSGRRNAFFLGPEASYAAQFKARFENALEGGGWRRPGFSRLRDGIDIHYADVAFRVHDSRMPFLASVYEFLAGLDGYAFYAELQTIFDEMTAGARDLKAIQVASNRIASRLRQYRRDNFTAARHDGKFDLILGFVMGRSPASRLVVDDDCLLDFWRTKSTTGDFRSYRTVFEAFAGFLGALAEARRAEAVVSALPVGTDRANGEVEPDDSASELSDDSWVSPLAALDDGPAAEIKFLKKEGERKPIEFLMHYGPLALALPLAFLRLETFGPIQSAITTDLQVGRGADRLAARLGCADAASYPETVAQYAHILELLRRLQKAAFYALHKERTGARDDADPERFDLLLAEAAKIFRGIARKGFDEPGLSDEQRIEGFRQGAVALVRAADHIVRYCAAVRRTCTEEQFAADCRVFGTQFGLLYGAAP